MTRIGRLKADGTGAALKFLGSKGRLRLRILRPYGKVSTLEQGSFCGNATARIALPVMGGNKARHVLSMT